MLFFRNRWLVRLKLCNGKSWWVPSCLLWFVKCFEGKCRHTHLTVHRLCLWGLFSPSTFHGCSQTSSQPQGLIKDQFPAQKLDPSLVNIGLGLMCFVCAVVQNRWFHEFLLCHRSSYTSFSFPCFKNLLFSIAQLNLCDACVALWVIQDNLFISKQLKTWNLPLSSLTPLIQCFKASLLGFFHVLSFGRAAYVRICAYLQSACLL